jgi:hypothetical protein
MRATPTGTPVMRIELDCGEGREPLRLGVVMVGEGAREIGGRISAGAAVKVTGTLRRSTRAAVAVGGERDRSAGERGERGRTRRGLIGAGL